LPPSLPFPMFSRSPDILLTVFPSPTRPPRLPTSTLFPYTTLFRSLDTVTRRVADADRSGRLSAMIVFHIAGGPRGGSGSRAPAGAARGGHPDRRRARARRQDRRSGCPPRAAPAGDRKSTRLNSSHL